MDKQTIIDRLDKKAYYLSHYPDLKVNGEWGQTKCSLNGHQDNEPSLFVNLKNGYFHCKGCGEKGSIFDHLMKVKGIAYQTAFNALASEAGLTTEAQRRVVKAYDYTDESGNILFQTVRYEPKDFKQRRPDGKGGWIYNLQGVRLLPYNLPEVIKANSIAIVEGEKDADNLKALGLTATCNPMGAGKWKPEYSQYFKGKKAVIIPDNDKPGRDQALQVAKNLKGIVESVKIVDLPDLKEKGDFSNWLQAGGTKERLMEIIRDTKEWTPQKSFQNIGMRLIKLDELLKEPDESVTWQVEGMLPTGGFSVLASKPKVGKSTLARNLALCTAQGEPFLNKAVNKGAVIYYALEEKKSEVKLHFRDMGATGEEEIYIYADSAPVDALIQIREVAVSLKPALIIVDPLFRLTRIKDGNDYAGVTQALEPLLRLARDTGSHVLCVHHTGKGNRQGGDSVLGSTAIFSSADTLLIMKRLDSYRTIHSIQRYGEDLEETTLHFDKDARTINIGKTKQEEDFTVLSDAIIEFLSSQSESVIEPVIMEDVEGRTGLKRKALRELVKEGRVTREGKGGKGDPFKYACSLVPTYIQEQENENLKKELTIDNHTSNACSQECTDTEENGRTREQAFSIKKDKCTKCSRSDTCMMTEGQRQLCKGFF